MAGIQWKGGKCHGAGEAKAMMRHACADERVRHAHSNADIDVGRTRLNTDLRGWTYERACAEYDARSKALAEATRRATGRALRSDAVTLLDAIVTVPAGLADADPARQDAWFRGVAEAIDRHYGAPVVLDAMVHRDEIHEYVDPDTGETVTSRAHAHVFCLPQVGGRLNAKEFTSRANMTSLNSEVERMTRERFQCGFMTGRKAKDRRFVSVEELKRASDDARMVRDAEARRQAAQSAAEDARRDAARSRQEAAEAAREADAARGAARDAEAVRAQAEAARDDAIGEAARAVSVGREAVRQAARSRQEAADAAMEAKASRSAADALKAEIGALEGRRDALVASLSEAEADARRAQGEQADAEAARDKARADAKTWDRITDERKGRADAHLREMGVTREGLMDVLRDLARAVAQMCVASWDTARDWARDRWADWMGVEAPAAAADLGIGEEEALEASDEELAQAATEVGREGDALPGLREAAGWPREQDRGRDGRGRAASSRDDWER